MTTHEREITELVSLCTEDGRLDPRAIGFTRSPLHRANLSRHRRAWGRHKRWEYWGLVTPTHVVGVTLASLDYLGLVSLYVLDRATGREQERNGIAPLARGIVMPDRCGGGPSHGRAMGVSIALDETREGTRIRAEARGITLDVIARRPPRHESLGVVVPWSERRFQYTVKDVGRPARGVMTIDGRGVHVEDETSFAVLDHGRGRWPYENVWNWAAGHRRDTNVSLQLGGRWTDGTGSTENGLFVGGRLHKIGETLRWRWEREHASNPWHIEGDSVDVTLRPFHVRRSRTNLGVLSFDVVQCFGIFDGWALDDHGSRVSLDGLTGWAEEAHNRW
jgi:hypothetical protein